MKAIILMLLFAQSHVAKESIVEKKTAQIIDANPVPVMPGHEILLFEIKQNKTGSLELSTGKNISNHPGYDSQPRFSNDGRILYYTRSVETTIIDKNSDKQAPESQTDIYQYNVATGETKPYMVTAQSEYSPTPMIDNTGLSVVQVDDIGNQYIVILNASENNIKRYSNLKQVGYFNWTGSGENWSFILNDSSGGDLYHMDKEKNTVLLSHDVGRSFVNDVTNKVIYYVDKNTVPWRIKSRRNKQLEAKDIIALPLGVEDFTVDNQGRFWAGRDNTLFISEDRKRWYIVAEFTNPAYNNITRLTTNPDSNKIAIVFAEKTE